MLAMEYHQHLIASCAKIFACSVQQISPFVHCALMIIYMVLKMAFVRIVMLLAKPVTIQVTQNASLAITKRI